MTKRISFILLIISVLLTFTTILYVHRYNTNTQQQERQSTYIFSSKTKQKIHDGDIILRKGFGWVSDKIASHLNEKFDISHCGIIRKKGNALQVLHAESSSILSNEGVQLQNLDDFTKASQKNSIIVLRLKDITPDQIKKIDDLIDFYAKKATPFDYKFDANDSTKIFCTELVHNIYKNATQTHLFVDENNEINLLQFNSLHKNKYIKTIINQQLTNK